MAREEYDEEAALEAALKASLMTVEEDERRRKEKYSHLYTTMIPPVVGATLDAPTSRSLTGSPLTLVGVSPSDPGLSNSQPSLKNPVKARSSVSGIARPRPSSTKLPPNDPFDAAFGTSSSSGLYPTMPSLMSTKTSPPIPPRPDVVPQGNGSKLPPPPLPSVGPNARSAAGVQSSSATSALDVLDKPLIKLSPPVHQNDPFGFDITSLDPFHSNNGRSQSQTQPLNSIGFEAWLPQKSDAAGASAAAAHANPTYGVSSNPFQPTSSFGTMNTRTDGQQTSTLGRAHQNDWSSASGSSSSLAKLGIGNYNTIQTTRGLNTGSSLSASTSASQNNFTQRGVSPSSEVQKIMSQQPPPLPAKASQANVQSERVQSPGAQQTQDQEEKHLSGISDLMDFSLDENEDFMTLGSFDPLTSVEQPTPMSDADLNVSFFAEPSPETTGAAASGSAAADSSETPQAQAAGFTLPLQKPNADIYAALRQPSPLAVKSPEEEHYEQLTLMKINEMVKKSPSPAETPTSEPVVAEGALQDPFSIDALTKELEEKRAKHAEEQAQRQALLRKKNAEEKQVQQKIEQAQLEAAKQEKKLFRRNSHMVKGQVGRMTKRCVIASESLGCVFIVFPFLAGIEIRNAAPHSRNG